MGARPGKWNDQLTERELKVLQEIANGRTNVQIALGIHVSLETVKTHVRHILKKLQVETRAAAVAEGFRRKLIV